jgi:nitronate monooxygenase
MAISTHLTRLLGIQHPLMSAPMAGVSGGRLANAFAKAGGLGLIGAGYLDADWIEHQLSLVTPGQAVGVGFITWQLDERPHLLQVALQAKPRAIFLSFGDIDRYVSAVHGAGSLVIAQVQNLDQARKAHQAGADIIVAQGSEAGGHSGQRGTMALVPALVDELKNTPIVAAGGIADGRGLVAALALGACGALLGTALYASEESLAHPNAKRKALDANGDDTIKSAAFDRIRGLSWPSDWRLRSLNNGFTQRWANDLPGLEASIDQERQRYAAATLLGDVDTAAVIVGEAIDLVHSIEPTADIVSKVIQQAEQVIQNLPKQLIS